MVGSLSVPLPCSEAVANSAALPPALWWDAARRGAPAGRPTARSTQRCSFEVPDRTQAGFSDDTLAFSQRFHLSFIRSMQAMRPGRAHFIVYLYS